MSTRDKFSQAQRVIKQGQAAFRQKLAVEDKADAARLKVAYNRMLTKLDKRLADLRSIAAEDGMTSRKFIQEAAVVRLRDDMQHELDALSKVIERAALRAEQAGATAAQQIAELSLRAAGVEGAFNQPSIESLRALAGFVDNPAFKVNIEQFAGYHANQVSDLILIGASKGQNPRITARAVTRYVDTFPLVDANRTVRTVRIWSARQGTLDIFRANADVVQSWTWSASIGDLRTCASCVMMHGTVHDLSETLDDHHSGRCAPIPNTPTWAELGFSGGRDLPNVQTGIAWFEAQDDATQRSILGNAAWRAWKDGAYELDQIPTQYQDSVYGPMRRAASLTELVGRDTARAYIYGKAA